MGILGDAGKNAGETAAQELHKAVDGAIPEAQAALDEVITRTATEIVSQLAAALTQAVGSMEIALGSFPEALLTALDGLSVEVSPITVKVTRRKDK